MSEAERPEPTRRSLLHWLVGGGMAAWAAAVAAPVVPYLWPAARRGATARSASAGPVGEFAVGSAKVIAGQTGPILVLRLAQDRFKAFSAVCTHLGCIVKWDEATQHIRCPCHAAVFGNDGSVVSGPPPAPLAEYRVNVVAGEVKIQL